MMVIAGPPREVSLLPAGRATVGHSSPKSRRAESCRARRLGRPDPGVPSILGQDAPSTAGVGSAGGGRRARGGCTRRPHPGCSAGVCICFHQPGRRPAWPAPVPTLTGLCWGRDLSPSLSHSQLGLCVRGRVPAGLDSRESVTGCRQDTEKGRCPPSSGGTALRVAHTWGKRPQVPAAAACVSRGSEGFLRSEGVKIPHVNVP